MRTVATLSIAPVKSMRLEHRLEVDMQRFGVADDRRFYVADEQGRMLNAVKHGRLLAIVPRYEPGSERLTLSLPDGTTVGGDAATVGRPVHSNFYGRAVTGHEVLGPWSDALSEYLGLRVRLVRTNDPGDGIDSYAASMFSTASADELDRQGGRSDRPLDRRRWRMLIEVSGCEPHEEDTWMGTEVRVGGAVLRVVETDDRCVITSRDPDTGAKDFDTLKTIAAYRGDDQEGGLPFGVYADVVEPGTIRIGDPVEPR